MTPTRVQPDRARVRRDELLDGLVDLYLAEGFLALGVGDLAARLRCSRSTLYDVASSKEQLIQAAVRRYFQRAAERIATRVDAEPDPGERIPVYLAAVAEELEPASARFHADLEAYAPAGEVYRDNTRHAARRVQELVADGVAAGALRPVDATFVGAATAQVMTAIQSGAIGEATGLDDASAYRRLADLVVHGLERRALPG
ncbi:MULTISPECIES: TetR/AcrR family transcriptional regulator [Nocardioides]|uniref:TetR/AcrR family transcriptional regulator n=1 Tax=Nocardioides TaxID=1839 RepID=UPI0009EB169F|nr:MULTISPECIES: TetR/AcrR family transcriptional regulator [Nocardioides]MCM3516723.1 TetR/AcrR family transcriptional regulator [Nocardioides sp. P86]